MKICIRCNDPKELDEFHKDKRTADGRVPYCKECKRKENKHIRSTPEFRERNARNQRERNMRVVYGITQEDYDTMYQKQNGKCAICFNPFTKKPHIDHCHKTGKFRGLLCGSCNTAIGLLKESVEVLNNAITYIESGYAESIRQSVCGECA